MAEAEQAAAQATATAGAATTQATTTTAAPAAAQPPDVAALLKRIEQLEGTVKSRTDEAAQNRIKAREEAEAAGRWQEAAKLREQEVTEARKETESFKARIAEFEPYAQTVKGEVDALRQQLGDKAPPTDGLSDAAAYRILKHTASLVASAGPGAARTTTAGNPAPVAAPVNFNDLTPDQVAALPKAQRRALIEQRTGAKPAKSWL
jgi:hypothetical protein